VVSQGGEIKGARSGLGSILESYGIPPSYLKEATTRQAHQDGQRLLDALVWGHDLAQLPDQERDDLLLEQIGTLVAKAKAWLARQNFRLDIDRRHSPAAWVQLIVENAKSRSGGVVEQHLVGAKLERRLKDITVPNYPAHAADQQTAREGDFTISQMVYHVTANPGGDVIQKCATNIRAGKRPILLIPNEQVYRAKVLAQEHGIGKELMVLSIEDFVAVNIVELAEQEDKDLFTILREIVQIYNQRLAQVETDLSLRIEVR
jgi:hypothetical protein